MPGSPSISRSRVSLQFFVVSVLILLASGLIAFAGIQLSVGLRLSDRGIMPLPFWISTVLLGLGSLTLHQAAWHVRFERQELFRRRLINSLVVGTLFVGIQCWGLWRLAVNQTPQGAASPESAETGANAFVAMLAGMHGVHFIVALLFVVWVTVNAFSQRYDHEYSWGVTFCAWFWHTLGILWLAILTLFAAGAVTGFEGNSIPDPQAVIQAD